MNLRILIMVIIILFIKTSIRATILKTTHFQYIIINYD